MIKSKIDNELYDFFWGALFDDKGIVKIQTGKYLLIYNFYYKYKLIETYSYLLNDQTVDKICRKFKLEKAFIIGSSNLYCLIGLEKIQ